MKKQKAKVEIFLWIDAIKDLLDREIWENTFIFTFLSGLVIHLVVFANYVVNHDSIALPYNSLDWLICQGKWFVTPIVSWDGPINISYLATAMGIVAFSLSAVVFCVIFHIHIKWECRLIGLCFVAFPSVATMELYQSADYFGIVFLLAIIGAYLLIKKGYINTIIGITCVVLSVGAYQPYIGVVLVILVMDCLVRALRNESWKCILKRGVKYIVDAIIGLVLYYVILKILITVKGITLSSYKGMDKVDQNLRPDILVNSIVVAYKSILKFFIMDVLGIYGEKIAYLNIVLMLLFVALGVLVAYKKKALMNKINMVMAVILAFFCLPLAANFIGVLSANSSFYYISVAPFVLLFLLPIVFLNILANIEKEKEEIGHKKFCMVSKAEMLATAIVILLICLGWVVQNNVVYQKAMLINEEYDAKLNILTARIQSINEYTEDSEIIIVGNPPYHFLDTTGVLKSIEEVYATGGYGLGDSNEVIYSKGILQSFWSNKYSVKINLEDEKLILNEYIDDIKRMAVYPDSESIALYDGKIVVKLSDNLGDN